MTARQQWAWVGIIVAALAALLAVASHTMGDEFRTVGPGSKAPNFRAKGLQRDAYKTLNDYKGKILVVNFWATYCDPCLKEMPSFRAFQDEFGGRGVALVAISGDLRSVTDDSIATFGRNYRLNFEVLRDDPARTTQRAFQTTGFPETFIIDKKGVTRRRVFGGEDWTYRANKALIYSLLAEEAVAQ